MRSHLATAGRAVGYGLLVAAALAAGACSDSSSASPNAPAASAPANAAAVWGEFVSCARAHGFPAWPDAEVDSNTGEATFPQASGFQPKTAFEAVREPCGALLDRLPPQANPLTRPVLSPAEIGAKLEYSRCMRENGVHEWQDPGADGYYTWGGVPGYNSDPAVTARVNAARDKCDPILGR
jgi:hypothetical protein